jgi:hypothetical protein
VKNESKEVDELYQALDQLSARLRRDCQQTGDRLLNKSQRRALAPAVTAGAASRRSR